MKNNFIHYGKIWQQIKLSISVCTQNEKSYTYIYIYTLSTQQTDICILLVSAIRIGKLKLS